MAGYAGAQYFLSRYDHLARISQEADKLFRSQATFNPVSLVIPRSVSFSDCCYHRVFVVAAASSHFSGRNLPFLRHPVLRLLAMFVFPWAGASWIYDSYHTGVADRRCVDD